MASEAVSPYLKPSRSPLCLTVNPMRASPKVSSHRDGRKRRIFFGISLVWVTLLLLLFYACSPKPWALAQRRERACLNAVRQTGDSQYGLTRVGWWGAQWTPAAAVIDDQLIMQYESLDPKRGRATGPAEDPSAAYEDSVLVALNAPKGKLRLVIFAGIFSPGELDPTPGASAGHLLRLTTPLPHSVLGERSPWVDLPLSARHSSVLLSSPCGRSRTNFVLSPGLLTFDPDAVKAKWNPGAWRLYTQTDWVLPGTEPEGGSNSRILGGQHLALSSLETDKMALRWAQLAVSADSRVREGAKQSALAVCHDPTESVYGSARYSRQKALRAAVQQVVTDMARYRRSAEVVDALTCEIRPEPGDEDPQVTSKRYDRIQKQRTERLTVWFNLHLHSRDDPAAWVLGSAEWMRYENLPSPPLPQGAAQVYFGWLAHFTEAMGTLRSRSDEVPGVSEAISRCLGFGVLTPGLADERTCALLRQTQADIDAHNGR